MKGFGVNALATSISRLAFSRRSAPSLTATANGLLAIAFCALLPARFFLFACVPLLVLVAWPLWQRGVFRIKPTDAVFVPDPLDLDFTELAKAIASVVNSAETEPKSIVACPVADGAGRAVPYEIAFSPKSVAVSQRNGGKARRPIAATVRTKAPLPVLVDSAPVKMTFEKARRRGDVVLKTNIRFKPPRGFVAIDVVKIAAALFVLAKLLLA